MLEITVKTLDSQNHSFTAEDDITVRGFKEYIAETVSVPAESQRLIYCGRVLQDDKKLNDYDVNGKVIHLVQRAPPQPESRSSNNDGQRQNNNGNWPHGGPRLQYRGHVHRNAMYVSAMPVSAELVEGHGLPAPQLSNTLSNSRLVGARRMLDKAIQLMDRLDDPSVPLHPSPTENNSSESQPPPSVPEEETEQDSSVNSNLNNARDRMVQAASEIANAFSAATLINIRLSHDNDDIESVSGTVNVMNGSSSEQSNQSQNQSEARSPSQAQSQVQPEAQAQPQAQPQVQPQAQSQDQAEAETQESEPQRSQTEEPAQQRSEREAPDSERGPRPPQMAELLDKLMSTQDRLRPHVEFYRNLMSNDPVLNRANGPGSVAESQRIVDGVSESLHYLAHACHALSDIIVDMGQQPPRNLRCRPLIIQHSAILQTGIPIQVESHINLSRNNTNSNNTTDEGNEATRPSSPSATSDQNNRSNNTNGRPASQSTNNQQNPASLLGTLLNLPNVELSMELSPQSAMDSSSPNTIVVDGSEIDQGQSNNNNGNAGEPGNMYSMPPPLPFAFIRDALQSVLSERHSQMEPSGTSINIGTPTNIPFVTIVGQQMDINTPNSGQSTQARSNIGTHPTTSTQTRSTARPHVLHPHTHPLNVGMGMGQSLSFDPFLPCNSHHVRRNTPASTSSTSTSQSNQANQSTTSESHSRTQSSSNSSSTSQPQSHTVNFTLAGDRNVTRDLENEGQALASGIRLAMSLGELFQGSDNDDVHISLVGSGPNANEIHLTPNSNVSLAEFLRLLNVRLVEFTTRNFLIDFWLFLLRNMTFEGLMQLSVGQLTPLISLRQPLREFLEHSFPNASRTTLQEQVAEQITSLTRPYLQTIVVPQQETASRPVDVSATIESLLRKFYLEFLRCLFNNDLDDTTFAQEAVALTKKLEEQSSAVLQYILQGGETTVQNIVSRFISQHLRGICHPFVLRALLGVLSTGVRSFATQTTSMSQSEITSLLVYKDETSSSSSQPIPSAPMPEDIEPEPIIKEAQRDVEMALQEEMQAQAPIPIQTSSQLPHQSTKPEVQGNSKQDISESMDLEIQKDLLEEDDPMDLAHGEEIPETFPGAENLPPEWVPIIARDAVRQRRQTQLNALQGGPIPFSDAYLSCMPSKRRKLIEQQKPQLLVNNPPPNTTAIAASVERLVREGISHTPQVSEVEGAANAVASSPGVRNAFGQAIKDCIHPSRFKTPDFPNAHRFPNASKYFANDDGSSKNKEKKDTSSTTTTPPASTTNMEK